MDVPVPFHLLQIKGAHLTFHTVWVLICTWVADVLEGGEVVEDLVPLHVGPHLGKKQQVSWCTRRGRMALHKLWTSTKGEFVVTQWHRQAWTQSTENRLLKVKQAAGFCFTICCWSRKGDKGVKSEMFSVWGKEYLLRGIEQKTHYPIFEFEDLFCFLNQCEYISTQSHYS